MRKGGGGLTNRMTANLAILYGFGGSASFLKATFLNKDGAGLFFAAWAVFYSGVRVSEAKRSD
jgi:hypothetical protein